MINWNTILIWIQASVRLDFYVTTILQCLYEWEDPLPLQWLGRTNISIHPQFWHKLCLYCKKAVWNFFQRRWWQSTVPVLLFKSQFVQPLAEHSKDYRGIALFTTVKQGINDLVNKRYSMLSCNCSLCCAIPNLIVEQKLRQKCKKYSHAGFIIKLNYGIIVMFGWRWYKL